MGLLEFYVKSASPLLSSSSSRMPTTDTNYRSIPHMQTTSNYRYKLQIYTTYANYKLANYRHKPQIQTTEPHTYANYKFANYCNRFKLQNPIPIYTLQLSSQNPLESYNMVGLARSKAFSFAFVRWAWLGLAWRGLAWFSWFGLV